ncbi:hypothetical protein ACOTYF_03050 [Enterobacter cloacae complex sp. JNL001]|uniref:hypothetical protein n=1 Tax=Enterobacter cloacae complex sp. JNL001 TaxID=3412379 RepID=UPI003BA6CD2B
MSTLTKEWLQKTIAELEEERDALPGAVNEDAAMALAAMKIALASLEAEAVAYMIGGHYLMHAQDPKVDNYTSAVPLYTAPPMPVSVPDDVMAAIQKVARIRLDLNEFDGDKRGIADSLGEAEEALIEVVNRRAAMLQGAEPVTTTNKLPEPIKDNRLNSGAEADDYYSGYRDGWNECLESVQVICEGNPDAK